MSRRYEIQQGVNNYGDTIYKKDRALFALCLFFFSLFSFSPCEPNLFINLVHRHIDVILPSIFHKRIEGINRSSGILRLGYHVVRLSNHDARNPKKVKAKIDMIQRKAK